MLSAIRTGGTGTCPPGCWLERDSQGNVLCYCPEYSRAARTRRGLFGRGLGIIPDFQFRKPPYNPEGYIYTDKLQFTADVPDQLTVQPVGPYITSGDANLQGLGVTMVSRLDGVFDSWWWENRKWLAVGAVGLIGLLGLGIATKVLR